MNKKIITVLSSALLVSSLLPVAGMAGNIKKTYINVAKEGQKAQVGDIPPNYGLADQPFKTKVYDFTVNGTNHGEFRGNATLSPDGFIGKALYLKGDNSHVRVPNHTSLQFGTGDFTYSFWFKVNTLGHTQQLFCKRGTTGNFEIQTAGDKLNTYFQSFNGTSWLSTIYSTSQPITVGKWHHAAVVRKAGTGYTYLDGKLSAQTATGAVNFNINDSNPLYMGVDGGSGAGEAVDGYMDEVTIWSRALEVKEIQSIVMNGNMKGNDTGLVSHYQFD